jgi:hypothetical protein
LGEDCGRLGRTVKDCHENPSFIPGGRPVKLLTVKL